MPQRPSRRLGRTAAALACLASHQGTALAQERYTLRCDVSESVWSHITGLPDRTVVETYRQTYRVDSTAKSVMQSMTIDQATGKRAPIDLLISDVRTISNDEILFCEDTVHACAPWVNRTAKGQADFYRSPILVNLATMRMNYNYRANARANDGPVAVFTTQATGSCVRE